MEQVHGVRRTEAQLMRRLRMTGESHHSGLPVIRDRSFLDRLLLTYSGRSDSTALKSEHPAGTVNPRSAVRATTATTATTAATTATTTTTTAAATAATATEASDART